MCVWRASVRGPFHRVFTASRGRPSGTAPAVSEGLLARGVASWCLSMIPSIICTCHLSNFRSVIVARSAPCWVALSRCARRRRRRRRRPVLAATEDPQGTRVLNLFARDWAMASFSRVNTGVGRNIRRDLIKTPSRRHFESKRTSKTGSTSKIGSRNGFVRFGKFCTFRSLSPYGVLSSVH